MAQPGWFPDPGGQPRMFRYWDGSAWTQQLSSNPPGQPPPPKPADRTGPIVAGLAALVVLVLLAVFVLPRVFGGDPAPSSDAPGPQSSPTRSSWDETTRPTPTPSATTPTKPPETSLPCPTYDEAIVDGRLFGGGLSVPVINDARWGVAPIRTIPWAICATGLDRTITSTWISEVILAGVQPRSLTGDLKQQADAIAKDSRTRFYRGDKTTYSVTSSAATTVDGLAAWELRYQVRIDYLPNTPGDNVDLLVVQHGDGSRSVLMTFATIGDNQTQSQVDASRTGVRVEKR